MEKVVLITYKHVLGATLAKDYLESKNIFAEMDELPQEGNAKLWVDKDKFDHAQTVLQTWYGEIQQKFQHMF